MGTEDQVHVEELDAAQVEDMEVQTDGVGAPEDRGIQHATKLGSEV